MAVDADECQWGLHFRQPQRPRQASSGTIGSSETHPTTQWPAIYYGERLPCNGLLTNVWTAKGTMCMMNSATCTRVHAKASVFLIALKRCTHLLLLRILILKGGIGIASFQLHKQAKQLVWICLTHHYAPLPFASKQLKLKVGERSWWEKQELKDPILKEFQRKSLRKLPTRAVLSILTFCNMTGSDSF